MRNIKMVVSRKEHPYSIHRSLGFANGVTYTREGSDQVNNGANGVNKNQFDVIDESLAMILAQYAVAHVQATVTIEGASIPESLQTFLVDKYLTEPTFTAINFV